ncbi:hypothetical protein D3C79_1035120 [compost metagenome]
MKARRAVTITPPIVAPNIGISDKTNVIAAVGIARFAGTSLKMKLNIKTARPAAAAPIADTVN